MGSIRISEKHGLNPSLSTCAWCGREKGEIVLFGRLKNDAEAPRKAIVDYEPCDTCKKQWQTGVTVIEVTRIPPTDGRPMISKDIYPTGRLVVVKPAVFKGKYFAGDRLFETVEDFTEMFGEAFAEKPNDIMEGGEFDED